MKQENKSSEQVEVNYSREQVQAFISEIAHKVVESNTNYMHSMLALNSLLRLPNAENLFDEDLRAQARDLWVKAKASGIQLNDPPLLFGYPEQTVNGGGK